MKIQKLSKVQENKLKIYRSKWLKIGLSTKTDRKKSEKLIESVYEIAGLAKPKIKIWLSSPHEGAIGAALLAGTKIAGGVVRAQVRDQVRAQVRDQVRDQVWDQVGAQVRAQVRAQVWAQVNKCGYGSHDANWLGFYEFFLNECKIKDAKKLKPMMELSQYCGWWWPFQNAVILTEKPKEIHRNPRNQLHRDGGPALSYSDGFSIYRLNGVRVSKEIVETPKDQITRDMLLSEKNVDIRREVVKKIGIERAVEILNAKVIDAFEGYELLSVDLGDGRVRPYLKMKNPSIEAHHIEGVRPGIVTVKEALCYRNGLKEYVKPIQLT